MIEADIEVLFVVKTSGFPYSQRFTIQICYVSIAFIWK